MIGDLLETGIHVAVTIVAWEAVRAVTRYLLNRAIKR